MSGLPGLREALERQTRQALASGALRPLATRREVVEDSGVCFVVHMPATILRKPKAATCRGNPFLPYDPEMFVADVTGTHVALLNKYNVIEHHLLIVTREYEDQTTPLTIDDFEALGLCMDGFESLGFYNGGREAGASQAHKHLQVVPLPLIPGGTATPVSPLLAAAASRPGPVPGFPFRHAAVSLGGDEGRCPAARHARYRELLARAGAVDRPYNLLVTREWMLCVPRSRESFASVSVNALGFAGSLFAANEDERRAIEAAGPMRVLREVGFPL